MGYLTDSGQASIVAYLLVVSDRILQVGAQRENPARHMMFCCKVQPIVVRSPRHAARIPKLLFPEQTHAPSVRKRGDIYQTLTMFSFRINALQNVFSRRNTTRILSCQRRTTATPL